MSCLINKSGFPNLSLTKFSVSVIKEVQQNAMCRIHYSVQISQNQLLKEGVHLYENIIFLNMQVQILLVLHFY